MPRVCSQSAPPRAASPRAAAGPPADFEAAARRDAAGGPLRRRGQHHVGPCECRARPGGLVVIQVGARRGLARIGVVTEHRDGLGQCRRLRRKPCEPQRDGARAGARLELAQAGHVRLGWHDPFDGDRVHEFAQEQRIAACLLVADSAEGIVGRGCECLSHEPHRRLEAEWSGADHGREWVGHDLV